FFFSSRRRHTRFSRDWSSDVCSSDLDSKVLYEPVRRKIKFFQGSISKPIVVRFIRESLSLDPTDNNEEEARLRPKTSVLFVRLAPVCSTSLLLPPKTVSRDFLSKSHFAEIPYLNLSSLKPYAPNPSKRQGSFWLK